MGARASAVVGPKCVAYSTNLGFCLKGKAEDILNTVDVADAIRRQVDLIFTSPPFPLNRKKKYGNLQGDAYIEWLAGFADIFRKLLKPKGSVVIELGNAWEPGKPAMSTSRSKHC
jgi:site-specific DNA-methyltransferase (cytosine-N4-specific)